MGDTLQDDYDQYLVDQRTKAEMAHEEKMRSTRVKLAKIEAKRAVKIARENSGEANMLRGFLGLFALVAVLIICVTYWATQPIDPEEERIKQERYELCMDVEEDYEKCDLAGD